MHPVVKVAANAWGNNYEVRCSLRSPDARNPCVRSIWVIDATNANPRLVTAYGYPWAPSGYQTIRWRQRATTRILQTESSTIW
jgi:hypothetical protein